MSDLNQKKEFYDYIGNSIKFFNEKIDEFNFPIRIFTHYDADGLCSGAILSVMLFREKIPYHLTIKKQLDRKIIQEIAKFTEKSNNFVIFSDFGSGQCQEIENNIKKGQYMILDHHLPQKIANKEMKKELNILREKHSPYHVNPYFFEIDGSIDVAAAGICYIFSKIMNSNNIDLSPLAIVAATGDIQNQGPNRTFVGLNYDILNDALKENKIEVKTDLNFSSFKPLNQAIAYSNEIQLPGLSQREDVSLKFLQKTGIFVENVDGEIKTLNDFSWDEKRIISSAIVKYAVDSCGFDLAEITKKLIINKYLLLDEINFPEISETSEFSRLLNSCGRTGNVSLGIAIAIGDRDKNIEKVRKILKNYKRKLSKSIEWVLSEKKLKSMDYIHYFYGEDIIPEEIIGTICSMLINSQLIDKKKPILGYANKIGEDFYKVSARATIDLVNDGVNLSQVIKEATRLMKVDTLGGGHPPAAGTKIKKEKMDEFLLICDKIIKKQLKHKISF